MSVPGVKLVSPVFFRVSILSCIRVVAVDVSLLFAVDLITE